MSKERLEITRRQLLARMGLAAGTVCLGHSKSLWAAPPQVQTSPVSIAKCPSYDGDLTATLKILFDQIGGIGKLVNGKTVAMKLNLTGGGRGFRPAGH